MSLFVDHLWIWVVLSFLAGGFGFLWYLKNKKGRNLAVAVTLPILIFSCGLILYLGVDTDQKSVRRALVALIAAVEKDDVELVCQMISPKAEEVQQLAINGMKLVNVSGAKLRDLQIEINDATSPPTAKVRFAAIFYWKNKESIIGFSVDRPVPDNVRIELELVKTKSQSWLVTDHFRYFQAHFL